MSTVALDIFTGAYPSISNDIEIRVYAQSDPLAIVASLRHSAPHLADTWSFPGLDRTNYLFRIFEMSGSSIVRQLGDDMNVVPGSSNGVAYRVTEQVAADVTTGFTSGVNVVTFDGTGGAPDWRGWDIDTLDRIGQDSMKRGVDYSYNLASGQLHLLAAGDLFGPSEWFNVQFATQVGGSTSSVPTSAPIFSTPKIVTGNYTVNAGTDFGGLLILKPSGNYMELTFPDIATVVAGKLLTIEMARAAVIKCCKFIFQSGQTLDWLAGARPDLYICPQESITIYKFIDTTGMAPVSQWRVFNPFGNFLRVGEQVSDDNLSANVFNKVLFDGSQLDVLQFARLYNDHVLQLTAQTCNYDDWTTGINRYKFSLANSSNPANTGKFLIPDRRNVYERNTDGTRLPGDLQAAQVGAFTLSFTITKGNSYTGGPNNNIFGNGAANPESKTISAGVVNVGNENRVLNTAIRKYLFV